MLNHTRPTRIVLVGNEGNGSDGYHNLLHQVEEFPHEFFHVQEVEQIRERGLKCDVILIDLSQWASSGLDLLGRARSSLPAIPVVAIVSKGAETVRKEALHRGAHSVLVREELDGTIMAEALRSASSNTARSQERLIEQALGFLQQYNGIAEVAQAPQALGQAPLCEAMPSKFLELTKSYSNVLNLALSRSESGIRYKGYAVSRRLHFLASDLGALHAGVWDVIDMHVKAIEHDSLHSTQPGVTSHKILLELISDLASYYRHSSYAQA